MNILMLLFKDIHYDARVKREALALADEGHFIKLICVKEYMDEPDFRHPNISLCRLTLTSKKAKQIVSVDNSQKTDTAKKLIFKLIRTPYIKVIKDIFAYNEFYKKIRKAVEGEQFNVIHCHDLNTLWQGRKLKQILKSKLIYDSHELFAEMAGRKEVDKKFCYLLEKRNFPAVDHLITVNPFLRDNILARNGKVGSSLIQNIPSSNNNHVLNPLNDYWRSTYSLSKSKVILLYQGGLSAQRGLEECILALNELEEKFVLVILGHGILKPRLEAIVKEHNLEARVFFHGQVPSDELAWYTKQADIGLVVYRNTSQNNYLSTPNKIFEYMQAGLPVVSSNHPGKSYIIEDEQIGVCVDEKPDAIVKGILLILENITYYKQNCARAVKSWNWENERRRLLNLYQEL